MKRRSLPQIDFLSPETHSDSQKKNPVSFRRRASKLFVCRRGENQSLKWLSFAPTRPARQFVICDLLFVIRRRRGLQVRALPGANTIHSLAVRSSFFAVHWLFTDYVSTARLRPVTDTDQTYAQWTSEFNCAPDIERELTNIVPGVYQDGFDSLRGKLSR